MATHTDTNSAVLADVRSVGLTTLKGSREGNYSIETFYPNIALNLDITHLFPNFSQIGSMVSVK